MAAPKKPTPAERLDKVERALGLRVKSPFDLFRASTWAFITDNRSWIIPVIGIFVAIFGWFASNLYREHLETVKQNFDRSVDERIEAALGAKSGVNERLGRIEGSTNRLESSLDTLKPFIHDAITHQFENASKLPPEALVQRLPAIGNLLSVAKDQDVRVDPIVVGRLGTKLVGVSIKHANAWDAAISALDYRSFVNTLPSSPVFSLPEPVTSRKLRYSMQGPTPHAPAVSIAGYVPRESEALLDKIGVNQNLDLVGPAYILLDGGVLAIDGMQLKNVVLRNVTVYYPGGPVQLTNVYFINCTFVMKPNSNSQNFALAALLPSPTVSFQAS